MVKDSKPDSLSECTVKERALENSRRELIAMIENAPLVMLLIDQERHVHQSNVMASKFANRTIADMAGRRAGEALRCVHSSEDPRGCGFSVACKNCKVRQTIVKTFETGQNQFAVEADVTQQVNGKTEDYNFLVSTTLIPFDKQTLSLVSVQDITDRKKTQAALRHSNEKLGLISGITSQLLSATKPQTLIQELCEKVMAFLNCDVFFNFLVNEEKEKLHLNAYAGITPEVAKNIEWLEFGEAVCGCAAKEATCIVCENIQDSNDQQADLVRSFGVKAYAANPLFSQGKVIGTLSFGSKKKTFFSEDELSLMKTVAVQVSIAMERKKTEDALRKSEASTVASNYARSLIEASLDPLVTISAQGKITDVNRATELATGCSRQELVNSDFSDYFTEPEKAKQGYREVFTKGFVTDYPLAIRHKTGKITHVLYNATVYRNEQGQIQGVFAAARDVTERKQAEEKLHAASLYARSLLEASLDPLVTINAQGKITDVNKATEEATGYSREQLIDSDFSDYFVEPQKARAGYQQVFTEGFVRDYPLAICHKSGKITDVLYNATLYRNETGEIAGIFAAARDITARKEAEEKLRTASLYARSLIEASLDPLVTISAEGKITDVNQATEAATGYSREQLIGSDFSNYFTEPEQARKGYQQVFTDGFIKDYPLAIRHVSGKITDVLYNAALFTNQAGQVQGVFAAARDITQRKIMENELRQTLEKLKQSNAELEQFAYVASHDLQEPLRMVASYVQLLERRYKGQLDSEADEFINYAVDGANRMRSLIDDLLTYSRVGRLGKPFERVNLETTFETVLKNLQASIADNHATVTSDKLPVVTADGGQLVQLFQNLVGNAIKFHGQEPPKVHISVKEKATEYLFSVKDNGIGIDPQYFDRLFRIFQRLHTREEYPGSGIGLAICKKIVERHGGHIWIESELGKGSTIHFTLKKKGTEKNE